MGQRRAGRQRHVQGKVALVELRDELATEPREQKAAQHEQDHGRAHYQPAHAQGGPDEGVITGVQKLHDAVGHRTLLLDVPAQGPGRYGRYVGEAQQHGPQDGEAHGEGHGAEHLARHAGEREDGEIHNQDDELPEQRRAHEARGLAFGDAIHRLVGGGLALVHEVENHGFHDNHGPVHDEAEVERAQAHQVGRHAEGLHHAQREEHAERNHAGHHQPGPPVAEQQQQHHHHDDAALDQVVHHRLDGLVDELGAVQKRRDDQSFGQGLLNLRHALFHAFDGGLGAGPLEHEHHAAHGFAPAVARHGSVAHGVAEARGGHVAHQQRGVGGGLLDDDFAQVLQRGGPALAPDEKGVGAALEVGPAGVGVVVLHGGE